MRFFFHIRDRDGLLEDPDGTDFADLAAAKADAVQAARELIAEAILNGKAPYGRCFEICDADHRLLATIPFADAVPGERGG